MVLFHDISQHTKQPRYPSCGPKETAEENLQFNHVKGGSLVINLQQMNSMMLALVKKKLYLILIACVILILKS